MNKEQKLKMIQKKSPELYDKVMKKELTTQQAYNEMYKDLMEVSEFKGEGTKGQNKIGLSKEVDRLNKMYKPTIEEWIEELKRLFPFTHQDKIK